jgi:voltage-gated potassium channel Kch
VGDAATSEVLENASIEQADTVVLILPDHRAAAPVVRQVRRLSPGTQVIVRARYHAFVAELEAAGAHAPRRRREESLRHASNALSVENIPCTTPASFITSPVFC